MKDRDILVEMHTQYLETLRNREKDIIQYLLIFVPAISAFGLLLYKTGEVGDIFLIGTVAVIGLLLLGAIYSLALGYNYRYIVFQLVKLERLLGIQQAMLTKWAIQSPKDFAKNNKYSLPEIIETFWWAFLIAILGVTAIAIFRFGCVVQCVCGIILSPIFSVQMFLFMIGLFCFLIGRYIIPGHYRAKLQNLYLSDREQDWEEDRFWEEDRLRKKGFAEVKPAEGGQKGPEK